MGKNTSYIGLDPLDITKKAAQELMIIQFELNKIIELLK